MLSRLPVRMTRAAQGVAFHAKPSESIMGCVREDNVSVAAESMPRSTLMPMHVRPDPGTVAAGEATLHSKSD